MILPTALNNATLAGSGGGGVSTGVSNTIDAYNTNTLELQNTSTTIAYNSSVLEITETTTLSTNNTNTLEN